MAREVQVVVELRDHVGTCVKDGERIEVDHDQWIVIVGVSGNAPKQRGYMAKRAGAPFLPLAGTQKHFGDYIYGEIVKAVEAARDAKFREVANVGE